MRKPRPIAYNPAQVLTLVATDRNGKPLTCPACGASDIDRTPPIVPPPPRSHVTLRCVKCGRSAHYIVGPT